MGKKKRSPALFEVLGRSKTPPQADGSIKIPPWWESAGQPTEGGEAPQGPAKAEAGSQRPEGRPAIVEAGGEVVRATRQVAAASERPTVASGGESDEPQERAEAMLAVRDSRLRISLSYQSGVLVALGLLLVLTVSFRLGHDVGHRAGWREAQRDEQEASLEAIRGGEPRPSVLERLLPGEGSPQAGVGGPAVGSDRGLSTAPRATAENRSAAQPAVRRVVRAEVGQGAGRRQVGLNYLVVQTSTAREPLLPLQAFLAERGVQATIEPLLESSFVLKSLQGYKDVRSREATEFREKVRALGREYASPEHRGQYNLQDCYYAKERG